jgi:hypothetical protein
VSAGRWRHLLKAVAIAYVLALTASPLAHHDLLCHVRPGTHCTTCHVGSADAPVQPFVVPTSLADAGPAEEQIERFSRPAALPRHDGRAPPSPSASEFLG